MSSDVLRTYLTQAAAATELLRQATVAIEDRRFYQHGGVDYEGLLRAALKDVFDGGGIQGGSTLTMQLVTNVYLPTDHQQGSTTSSTRSSRRSSPTSSKPGARKDWILTQYLNDVPYGTTYGQTAIGVGGRVADVLRQAGAEARSGADARCSPACRRRRPTTTRS